MKLLRDRRGISPVITTVIIVAVGITLAIAVMLWVTGLAGSFMSYERIEVTSLYATPLSGGGWTLTMRLKNVGQTPTKIDNVFINDVPYDLWNPQIEVEIEGQPLSPDTPAPVNVGDELDVTITIRQEGTSYQNQRLVSGGSVQVKIHTSTGREYYKSTQLP
ncbi:MAG: archaellin/type IV pilin N-terminal domain-containing protein [Thermoproteota archaeon]